MKIVGGIIALVSGIVGILYSLYYFYDVVSNGLNTSDDGKLLLTYFVLTGVAALVVLFLGAKAIDSEGKKISITLVLFALIGIGIGTFLLYDFVAISIFIFTLIGGMLSLFVNK